MRMFLVATAFVLSTPVAAAQANRTWAVATLDNPLAAGELRAACYRDGDLRFCVNFDESGAFMSVEANGLDTLGDRFPTLRVDQNPAFDAVDSTLLQSEASLRQKLVPRVGRERVQHWRAQVPSESGRWEAEPPVQIRQMVKGRMLTLRVYFEGDEKKDLTINLTGFCRVAAEVYAPGAPPLRCG